MSYESYDKRHYKNDPMILYNVCITDRDISLKEANEMSDLQTYLSRRLEEKAVYIDSLLDEQTNILKAKRVLRIVESAERGGLPEDELESKLKEEFERDC
jgi:hypothetical protein